jgi:hypothetical protein
LRELERKVKAFEGTRLQPNASPVALSQELSTSTRAKNVATGEDEEEFEDEQPLLELFTNLSLHKPSTSK